jgi:hypothetical protein
MELKLAEGENGDERQAQVKRQRMRSIAIAVILASLVVLFYAATIVRMGAGVFDRPM